MNEETIHVQDYQNNIMTTLIDQEMMTNSNQSSSLILLSNIECSPNVRLGTFSKTKHEDNTDNENPAQDDNTLYAVKCIPTDTFNIQLQMNEIEVLSKCHNIPSVAHIEFAFQSLSMMYIGVEFCEQGDLYTLLTTRGIDRIESLHFLSQIGKALGHLHQHQIIYHDLRPENICFDSFGNIKLIGFNLATIIDATTFDLGTQSHKVVTSGGTLEYSAPEIFLRLAHGYEVDWWSFGVISYELLCGELPFYLSDVSPSEQCDYICSNADFHRNDIIVEGSVEESFVNAFLQKNPLLRVCSASFIEMHPLFVDM